MWVLDVILIANKATDPRKKGIGRGACKIGCGHKWMDWIELCISTI